jgi:hypothetical protein
MSDAIEANHPFFPEAPKITFDPGGRDYSIGTVWDIDEGVLALASREIEDANDYQFIERLLNLGMQITTSPDETSLTCILPARYAKALAQVKRDRLRWSEVDAFKEFMDKMRLDPALWYKQISGHFDSTLFEEEGKRRD